MHELAALTDELPSENVEFLQEPEALTEIVLVRCPSCQGLRGISSRNRKTSALCHDCRKGRVVPRWTFCTFWVERFTEEEIEEMAKALFG